MKKREPLKMDLSSMSALTTGFKASQYHVEGTKGLVMEMPVADISPDPTNARKHFDPDAMTQLRGSIRSLGVVQPIVIRADENATGKYVIVAGERRWRCSKELRLETIPAVVRKGKVADLKAIQITENFARSDLRLMEKAVALREYIDLNAQEGMDQRRAAERLGYTENHVGQLLKVLTFAPEVQKLAADGLCEDAETLGLLGRLFAASPARFRSVLEGGDFSRPVLRKNLETSKPGKGGKAGKKSKRVQYRVKVDGRKGSWEPTAKKNTASKLSVLFDGEAVPELVSVGRADIKILGA